MDPVAFSIFGKPIYWYGIIISAGVMIGIYLAMHNAKYFKLDSDSIIDFALLAIPMAIVGARLYYVVFEWDQYDNLLDIINIRKGGLAIYGAVLAGILAGFIFARWKRISFWNLADICIPSVILGQAVGRWGNFFNQEAFGYEITNPAWQWFPAAVFIDADSRWHMATFFYESMWNLIVFAVLMLYRKRRKREGEVFLLYLILYSAGRVVIEGLRTDSLYWGPFRVSQVLSGALIVLGAVLFYIRRRNTPTLIAQSNLENASTQPVQSDSDVTASSQPEQSDSDGENTSPQPEQSGPDDNASPQPEQSGPDDNASPQPVQSGSDENASSQPVQSDSDENA